jgi:hypothetical protein
VSDVKITGAIPVELEEAVSHAAGEPDTPYLKTPEERVRFFREWMSSLDPDTPVLSDEAMSRESIY